jgi:hypothetical protein
MGRPVRAQKYCTLLIDDQEVAAEHAIAILGGAHQGAGLGPVRYAIDPPSVSAADNPGNDHATASWKLAAGKSRAAGGERMPASCAHHAGGKSLEIPEVTQSRCMSPPLQ